MMLAVIGSHTNQLPLLRIHRTVLARPIAEPNCKACAPDHADGAEQDKRTAPSKLRNLERGIAHQNGPQQRRQSAHQSAGHPNRALRCLPVFWREPIVNRTGDVRIRARFPCSE
jgi:hypothetical protein